jgi:ribosomal protein S27AE
MILKIVNLFLYNIEDEGVKMILGSCPYCSDGSIIVEEKEVRAKKVKLYRCSNAKYTTEDGELYEVAKDATCSYQLWQNALARYGKWLSYKEVRTLLVDGELEVELLSKKYGKKIYYTKIIILDEQYGVSVLWD